MNICVATGSRAEYGLLRPLMNAIKNEPGWNLQILATGAHLSPEFGLTYAEIEEDGFKINKKVEMLLSADSASSIIKSMGMGMIGYADALQELKPDLLFILGDRYEMLSVATSALILKIPIAHIHGGEITEGAYDDMIRHSITKMSHLHFTSTEEYRRRVIQMGEQPDFVYNVGAIGLDNICSMDFMSRNDLERKLGITFNAYNYIVAFHPETMAKTPVGLQFEYLLGAIEEQKNSFFIFTKSNADTDGRTINHMIDSFIEKYPEKAAVYTSLGTQIFLSIMKVADAIIGNSSSGIIEAPSLNTATINIGNRQKGRVQASSVLNCICEKSAIRAAFDTVKSLSFKDEVKWAENPYKKGVASRAILEVIKNIDVTDLRVKHFNNIENGCF